MTVLTETPRQQATTLSMKHAYNEAPGVKKLARGYKLLPKVSPVSYTHLTLPTNREV